MKYLNKSFTVAGQGAAYRDGWDRVFGKKDEAEYYVLDRRCHTCHHNRTGDCTKFDIPIAPESWACSHYEAKHE